MKVWINILFVLLFVSCSEEKSDQMNSCVVIDSAESYSNSIEDQEDFEEYSTWLKSEESNHFCTKSINEFNYVALLEPSFYSYVKNEGIDKVGKFHAEDFSNQTRIEYSISVPGLNGELIKYLIQGREDYNERIQYYSFNVSKDMFLVVEGDTVGCGMSVWEREFNSNPSIKLQLLFPLSHEELRGKSVQLVYYDRVFDNGLVKMKF